MNQKISVIVTLREKLRNHMQKLIIAIRMTLVELSALLFMVLQRLLT